MTPRRTRVLLVALLGTGLAVQFGSVLWAFLSPAALAIPSEDMVPFTYLLGTMASVLAGIMAVAGSVLILSMTLGSPVQRSHLGGIVLTDPDFRLAQTGAIVTILACCLSLLLSHLPDVSHSGTTIFLLSFGGYLQFGAVIVALVRLFRTIPTLLTQERLLGAALSRLDAAYLASRERRLVGVDATERGRTENLNDLIFAFRIAPGEEDDPLVTVHDVLENVVMQSPASVVTTSLALVARKLADLVEAPHDRIYQLLVTPWLAELRVPVVRRGSPSIALAYFDAWGGLLRASRGNGMDQFVANSARPFVGALRDVARSGLFDGLADRALRPLARIVGESGVDAGVAGPWVAALVAWMREDAERGVGAFASVLWHPVERYVERLLADLDRDPPLLPVLVHGLTAFVRAAARSGLLTETGEPFDREV
ncbi:MAG TPA: hypothetical protein PLB02_10500, partial [Thermoanaerobaculia bacterium]|nr:hypothetical protein [Thermoanaerobaculia bacterium]